MPEDVEQLRAHLLALRQRRERLDGAREVLAEDIRTTLRRAHGLLSMSEAARLLGLDRAGLYRTYR